MSRSGKVEVGGGVRLAWREWGEGPIPVLFIHGNLASKDWIERAARWFPEDLRVVGVDWRGCGDSDKPAAEPDYANYTMAQHAADMLAALDGLGIGRCHLATHSTGGIIAARMMLAEPDRFGRCLALDPVTPLGLKFDAAGMAVFRAMQASREVTRAGMATAAASLFLADSLTPGSAPKFREGVGELQAFFEKIVDQTFAVAEGIWFGTPHNLNLEYESGDVARRMHEIAQEHLVLWGELDGWIPAADVKRMAAEMPHCRLVAVPGIGHSMNLEEPALYAGYLGGFLSGVEV
ncbi:alpha/beta hydrolase [Amaricoccus sp.]|uniref:alpha/beta fold hydrolase n=1 Tax=Amaricoccus sp. TaxID=1872485 RepID=UPI001B49F6BC|nr:alpha/beta hydrolase [Amaricoccus sp.]MBP7240966.1 alpha/beta hydrolase [Amaricoccus sp.]